jgi:membrane fusion protein (multidrug efflux system)
MKTQHNFINFKTGLLAILIPSLFLGWVSCTSEAKNTPTTKAATAAPVGVPVDAIVLKSETIKDEMEATGTLVANQAVDIVSELNRKVIRVNVKEGSVVGTGALLFQLDDADLQAQLEQLIQQQKLARLNEQRLKDLIQHQAVIQQDYDQTFTNLKVIDAQVQQLRVMIEKTRIRAPFSGRIGIIHVYPGSFVTPQTVMTNLVDYTQLKLDFTVPEKYAAVLREGSQVKFTVESNEKTYTATVQAHESKLDQNTRTLLIRAVSPNPKEEILPGQSARLNIALNSAPNSLMVPSQALMPSSQGYTVYAIKNNKATMIPIQTGQRSDRNVQVLSGLAAGDTLITSNLMRLSPGAAVQVATINSIQN